MNEEPTSDLLATDWEPVYKELGHSKTLGLIKNGTSLTIALEMVRVMRQKENLTLFD